MISVAEYVADALAAAGLCDAFIVTGGGAMFLNDALAHHPALRPLWFQHEQAAAMAGEAYARIAGKPAIVNVTTGPGGINALNGVFGAWTDSIPLLVISGQVKRQTSLAFHDLPELRQLGDQEARIVDLARPICKSAVVLRAAEDIAWELERALHLACSGRPGPCWLDIPIDLQAAPIDPGALRHFTAPPASATWRASDCDALLARLAAARRPVILAGTGVRCAAAEREFETLIRRLAIPVVTAWTHDLIADDDPLYCGRPGTIGTRAGNFTVQEADLLLILGSRLNIRQVSYNWAAFAPQAFKIQVDIDPAELAKPLVVPDLAICADLRDFLATLNSRLAIDPPARAPAHEQWLARCRQRLADYPSVLPRQREFRGRINPYHFVEELFACLQNDDIVACGNASATIVTFQAARLKAGQRVFSNSGSASMGYDLPAAIGAWYGARAVRGGQRRVVCLAGDGSLMMNLQELQTVAQHRLPIKIFVLDNRGYLSIRTSQSGFFGRLAGAGPESGVQLPDFVAVARAFGLPARRLDAADFAQHLPAILDAPGPALTQVVLDETQEFEPRIASRRLADGSIVSAALDDMYPFLKREE